MAAMSSASSGDGVRSGGSRGAAVAAARKARREGRGRGACRSMGEAALCRASLAASAGPDQIRAMRTHPPPIAEFLAQGSFAVVGASTDRAKYGNKVLRCYLQHGLPVVAVNPGHASVEGVVAYPSLRAVPATVRAASVVAPP